MRTEVSIILPTIRKYLWNDFYKSLKNSLHREFELILVTPHKELTQELKDKENIKLITDYGSANRCQQIALCNATGKYIKWAADDELFYENIHDEILDLVGSCDTHPMADPYTDDGATITFVDTDFGDDSQLEIKADCSCDPINEYLCFDHEREAIKEKYPNAVYTDQCIWEVDGKEVEL